MTLLETGSLDGDPGYTVRGYWEGYSGKMDSEDVHYLRRAMAILTNMAAERERRWWEFWVGRWAIHDEPLRNDANNFINERKKKGLWTT